MIEVNIAQQDQQWFTEKAGKPSASEFKMIVDCSGKPSTQRNKYLYTLVGERFLGTKVATRPTFAMQRGIELEAEARMFFELLTGLDVRQTGFIYPDERKLYGCSPDGVIQENIGLEIKCPALHTHMEYLHKNKLPSEYKQQVQGSMMVTEFKSWYFMSYYPGLEPLILEVKRDEKYCEVLQTEVEKFCKNIDKIYSEIRGQHESI